jgi:hypothetical protein
VGLAIRAAATAAGIRRACAACADDPSQPDGDLADSPLDAIWAEVRSALRETDRSLEMEAAISSCLAHEGFEYIPQPSRPEDVAVGGDLPGWSDEADALSRGYGFVLVGEAAPPTLPSDDPNEAIVAAFGEAERAEYLAAL